MSDRSGACRFNIEIDRSVMMSVLVKKGKNVSPDLTQKYEIEFLWVTELLESSAMTLISERIKLFDVMLCHIVKPFLT